MADAEFEAGQGSAEQLPQGAATAANEGTNVVAPPAPETEAPVAPEAPPEAEEAPATPADFDPQYLPETDDEAFLAGPTERPDEASWVGAMPQQGQPPIVRRHMTLLQEAAAAPGASAELQALISYLLRTA